MLSHTLNSELFHPDSICPSTHLFISAKRKTVTSLDVVYALKRQGRTLYGSYLLPVSRNQTNRTQVSVVKHLALHTSITTSLFWLTVPAIFHGMVA